ncbi:hypothetical protein TraAM80_09577 [Trypanosoma rangeli]|uniref:Uncharacterized protein n=1 Tax=Trypanosoma rangeli TaxID=5698 RepID=A0A422MUK7_TRYRA|nr:uncharacterized protein TraAM80_09577 [Trypanosoma rangeli]RNE96886.1 hypothetical protein TraAM80_09577 [Trypanosoma rangeli]|eukprot:RNE96886.1 hypothetical protein TraAM80_09577 [Trypanosoma rangeli]
MPAWHAASLSLFFPFPLFCFFTFLLVDTRGEKPKMSADAQAIAYFWDTLLYTITPAQTTAKQRRRQARKSVFCCSNSDSRPANFWFCRSPQLNRKRKRKPEALTMQQRRKKKVHFSDEVEVILIDRRIQPMY